MSSAEPKHKYINRNYSYNYRVSSYLQGSSAVGFQTLPKNPVYIINSRIDKPETWNKLFARMQIIKDRVESCKDLGFGYWVCSDCGETASDKPYKLTCSLRYCTDPDCVRARIRKSKIRLHNYKIYSKRLIHFEVSFPYVPRLHKAFKSFQEMILRAFTKEMKKLGTPINALRVFDVKEKSGHYFMHYHFAQMPVKDYMHFVANSKRAQNKTIEKFGLPFITHFEGWREKRSLFSYFAKRMAGVYGDVSRSTRCFLKDMISLREYAQGFFNSRSFNIIGLFPRQRRGNVLNIILSKPSECPYCHSKSLKLLPEACIKPPPLLECKQCGLEVRPREYSAETGLCKFCHIKTTPRFKINNMKEKIYNYLNHQSKSMRMHPEKDPRFLVGVDNNRL